MRTAHAFVLASALLSACTGEVLGDPSAISMWGDASTHADRPSPRGDASSDSRATGSDASPAADVQLTIVDSSAPDTFVAPVDSGVAPACNPASCVTGATCDPTNTHCICGPGFTGDGTTCTPVSPDDPQTRTREVMCARWNADRVLAASRTFIPGASQCDPGQVDPTAHDDGMRVLNLYRWLSGVGPASADASLAAGQQACAMMESMNAPPLNHFPPTTWTCYRAEGAGAAGSSNLAWGGYMSPASSVDLYVRESGSSLGHRRWCLDPALGGTWFGAYEAASCMHSFPNGGDGSHPQWIAFPNPGPAPIDNFGVWSVQSNVLSLSAETATITVTDTSTGTAMTVQRVVVGYGYAGDAIAWQPSGWTPREGVTYSVTVSIPGGTTISYTTTPVRC